MFVERYDKSLYADDLCAKQMFDRPSSIYMFEQHQSVQHELIDGLFQHLGLTQNKSKK